MNNQKLITGSAVVVVMLVFYGLLLLRARPSADATSNQIKLLKVETISSEITSPAFLTRLQARNVNERMLQGFQNRFSFSVEVDKQYVHSLSTGCFIHGHAEYEHYKVGDDMLGEPTKQSEEIGEECAEKMIQLLHHDGVVEVPALQAHRDDAQ